MLSRLLRIVDRKIEPTVPSGHGIDKASSWWEADSYTDVLRERIYTLAGVPIFKRISRLSIWDVYAVPADDTVAVIKEMIAAGLVPPLSRHSSAIEGGCNVGRNLRALRNEFACSVTGLDISVRAVDLARDRMFAGDVADIRAGDLLDPAMFESFAVQQFDLALTRWNLIHIPASEAKKRYVEEMKRISKTLVIMEPTLEDRAGVELSHDGAYALSWDNWTRDYGLSEFVPRTQLPDATRVFFSRRI